MMPKLSQEKKEVLEAMTRDALYTAAWEILCDGGWKELTMEKLAKRAGVAKGTVYNYFQDKRDIVFFVIERSSEPLRESIRALTQEDRDPGELLGEILETLCNDMFSNSRMIMTTIRALHEEEFIWEKDFPRRHPMAEVRANVLDVLRRGVEGGVFRPYDPALLEVLVNSVLMGLGKQIFCGELDDMKDSLSSSLKDIIMNGLLTRKEGANA